jgi:hypothetical protein
MGNTFCKIEDSNKNKYILTDKNKQPLQCQSVLTSNSQESEIGSCRIMNIKKILDDSALMNDENIKNPEFLIEDTKIPCKVIRDTTLSVVDSEPINKSNINFDNYNIASINKNIIVKDVNDRVIDKEIEYNNIYFFDKNNIEEIKKINDFSLNPDLINKEIFLESMDKMYNYKQKLFNKEDISKPSENQNNNNMYIGIGVGIGVLLLMIAFFLYIRSKSKSNSNVIDTTSTKNTNSTKNRSRNSSSR